MLNRNYVKPELIRIVFAVAEDIHTKHPETTINYLDANFPFINKFPLFPHLSHNDGKKLDLSFFYKNSKTGIETSEVPSWIGYGICEEPKPGEENRPDLLRPERLLAIQCVKRISPAGSKKGFQFDEARTRLMINSFGKQKNLGKILIGPHLKQDYS